MPVVHYSISSSLTATSTNSSLSQPMMHVLEGLPKLGSDEQLTVGPDRDGPHDKCAHVLLSLVLDSVPPQFWY